MIFSQVPSQQSQFSSAVNIELRAGFDAITHSIDFHVGIKGKGI